MISRRKFQRTSAATGPFHVADAPELPTGSDRCLDQKGEPMSVHGFQDAQQQGILTEANPCGTFRTGSDGGFRFKGVQRKFYPVPDDGPVGQPPRPPGRFADPPDA